jgi:hypothetical protein
MSVPAPLGASSTVTSETRSGVLCQAHVNRNLRFGTTCS